MTNEYDNIFAKKKNYLESKLVALDRGKGRYI